MGISMNMPRLSRDQRQQSIQRLVGSMRRRCTACIQNNGGHTRYWKGTDFAPSAVMYWWDGLSWSKTWHVINKMPMFQLAIVSLFYFELFTILLHFKQVVSFFCVWVYILNGSWLSSTFHVKQKKSLRFLVSACVTSDLCVGIVNFLFLCYAMMPNCSQNCWIAWIYAVLCFKWLFSHRGMNVCPICEASPSHHTVCIWKIWSRISMFAKKKKINFFFNPFASEAV